MFPSHVKELKNVFLSLKPNQKLTYDHRTVSSVENGGVMLTEVCGPNSVASSFVPYVNCSVSGFVVVSNIPFSVGVKSEEVYETEHEQLVVIKYDEDLGEFLCMLVDDEGEVALVHHTAKYLVEECTLTKKSFSDVVGAIYE